jgi:hypothetical protein
LKRPTKQLAFASDANVSFENWLLLLESSKKQEPSKAVHGDVCAEAVAAEEFQCFTPEGVPGCDLTLLLPAEVISLIFSVRTAPIHVALA